MSKQSHHVSRRRPPHPYWCDECGQKAPFTIPETPVEHQEWCSRYGEDAVKVFADARDWCIATGKSITLTPPRRQD